MKSRELNEFLEKKFWEIINGPLCLDKAILLAVVAHGGQRDKAGAPYIRHPLRVMERMDTEDEQIPAILHDVVEDTEITLEHLEYLGLSMYQVAVVDALSKREGEEYADSMSRVKKVPTAKKIKCQDIRDNLQLWRLKNKDNLQEKDLKRIKRYIEALSELGDH
jgi:(p)ppGpp synthase/HD superfamily hydrolase